MYLNRYKRNLGFLCELMYGRNLPWREVGAVDRGILKVEVSGKPQNLQEEPDGLAVPDSVQEAAEVWVQRHLVGEGLPDSLRRWKHCGNIAKSHLITF